MIEGVEALEMKCCIFCKNLTDAEPIEHIVPQGLIGHQQFQVAGGELPPEHPVYLVLGEGQVCGACNRGPLAKLDEHLQKQFGLFKVLWNPIGTKSRKPAKAERPGLYAIRRPDGPLIAINSEAKKVSLDDGVVIQPPNSHPEAVRLEGLEVEGALANVRFSQPMWMNKRFIRGLHKIAFELLCLQQGSEYVLDSRFDLIREYIIHGKGNREIVFSSDLVNTQEMPFFCLQPIPGTPDWIAELNLGLAFFVDLSPGNDLFKKASVNELQADNLIKLSDSERDAQARGEL